MADEELSFQLRNIFRKIANHHPASDRDGAVEISNLIAIARALEITAPRVP
jgi:hypothetical protein